MDTLVDIITLDNLAQKMPRWDPAADSQLYALVDMGSNGIRFSISDLSPPRARLLRCVYRERAAISLFDALSSGPSLLFPDETISLVAQTLARFWAIAVDDYGVPPTQMRVFATEAMRRAQNATAMLEAIRAAAPGLSVCILAPQVETLFGSLGARSGFVDVKGLFLDLGGGSVQMTYLDTQGDKAGFPEGDLGPEVAAALAGQSLPFGAARLIKVLEQSDAETQAAQISQLRSGMSEAFRTLRAQFPSLAATAAAAEKHRGSAEGTSAGEQGIDVYLCGGGFRGYGSMLMHNHPIQPYPVPSVGSLTVSGTFFGQTQQLLKFNCSFDDKIFGMSKRRRAQFPAIIAVVEALIAAVPPIRSVTFCSGGNREGALMVSLPSDVRESNPLLLFENATESPVELSVPSPQRAEVQDVLDILLSAFPPDLHLGPAVTVFGLQLGARYARQIWTRLGEDDDANASAALHDAISCPDQPGLTHLARAVLGVTLCARWGARLAPIDEQLHQNLRALMDSADPDASFWADYTGAVTAAMATLLRRWPKTQRSIRDTITFRATSERGKKKLKVHLEIRISVGAAKGTDPDSLLDLFKALKKRHHDEKKVTVTINP
ncbi:Ppx/GppA phosphatase family-domain-containing protein [Staphylotrichum tortipilum]|uniref:Ppx/GppA phosphatase family-domain-containing protein n=1 Tax=Staphylotrichum tortipilum TaxID=2831512 RepID=A0AAN6MW76_9PEZI|nr:Ppx/GppA phosphatase family-domain-containing protein [Staphylotrichum longicolle]